MSNRTQAGQKVMPTMIDGWERVTARVPLTEDVQLPAMIHAAVLRSPYPHALISRIDASAALACPGVVAVLTRDDILGNPEIDRVYGPQIEDNPIVALDRVHHVGDPVAAIAAVDEKAARQALALIEVDYDPLPAVFDAVEAAQTGSPLVQPELAAVAGLALNFDIRPLPGSNVCHHFRIRRGDVDEGFARAELIVEDTFTVASAQHVPMEPHVAVATWEDGGLTVYTGSQTPFDTRRSLAKLFHVSPEQVRVIVPSIGGGYGSKSFPRLEPIAALLAKKTRRPVRLALGREEEFVTLNRHASTIRMRLGLLRDGTLVAKQIVIHWNTGAYADSGPGVAQKGGYHAVGPYRIPNVSVDSYCVYTNLPPNGAFRGYSATQPVWATERLMDLAADRLGLDPLELRLRNLLRNGEAFVTGEVMHDVHFAELLRAAAEGINWSVGKREELSDGRIRAKGLGITLKGMQTPSRCSARVGVDRDGVVTVYAGTVEMGQGSRTVLAQIAAELQGQSYQRIRVISADTAQVPFDTRTTSSRSSYMMGNAVRHAATELRKRLIALAAERLGATVEELDLADGVVYVRGVPERRAAVGELVAASGEKELVAEGEFRNAGGLNPDTGQGIASSQWNQSAIGAIVLVDPETGKATVEHVHAAVYAGKVINPTMARLQTEGNVIFGVGSALFEEIVFSDGQAINPNLSDYLIPSMADIPPRVTLSLLERAGAEIHGLGETALPPTPAAIGNAIARAVGKRLTRLPVTPERVLAAPDAVAGEQREEQTRA